MLPQAESLQQHLYSLSENPAIVFHHGVKTDPHSRAESGKQKYHADPEKRLNIRKNRNPRENAEQAHARAAENRPKSDFSPKRQSVRFADAVGVIRMQG